MSRACCTAIIIFISISFSILLRFWTKEYSNSESNKQTPFSPSFLRPPSAERGEIGGNWLRLWKLVNHDGALPPPPIKIGERAGKLVSREQLFLSDEGNDDGRAGKLRLRRPPPAFRGRKKARGPARERLVNSSRSAPFPYERQPFDKSATKDLWLNTSVSQSGVERTVNAKIQPLRPCLDARPSIIDPASAMGWKSHWRKTVEFLEIPDTDGWNPGYRRSSILLNFFFFSFLSYFSPLPFRDRWPIFFPLTMISSTLYLLVHPLGVQSRLDERLEHPLTNFTVNTTMKESTSPRREVNEQLLDGISPVFPFFFLFLRKRVEGKGDTKGWG